MSASTVLLSLLLVVVVGALLLAAFLAVRFLRRSEGSEQAFKLLQQQLEGLRGQSAEAIQAQTQLVSQQLHNVTTQVNDRLAEVSRQLTDSQKNVGDRLDNAARVVGEVQKNLGALGQASQKIFEVGKDISGLQDLLRAPKMRGGLGEYFLGDLLTQILPARHFTLQYGFKTGQTVDAVVRLGERLVPVDAKFPLENFRRSLDVHSDDERRALRKKFATDVKKHVDAIATKYILPDENTYDFAMMYIPAENVYYECIIKDENAGEDAAIIEYALRKRVVPVSPASFYAYLQAIVLGLRGFQIEESAHRLMDSLARLRGDFQRFIDEFETVGKHLMNARTKYDDAGRRLERFNDKLTLVTGDRAPALPGSTPAPSAELFTPPLSRG
jgi:DNA recombination protein RmuC